MKKSNNIEHYKEKVIELADTILEKDKQIKELKEQLSSSENYCNSLSGFCNCCKSKLNADYTKHIKQLEDEIKTLTKQKDNWKADCEYNEECFQAEREARYKLEDEVKVLKGEKKYPCISLKVNDITGESSSLYFCFSYDEKVLLANNVPKLIFESYFQIHASVGRLGLTYHITCPPVLNPKTDKPYVYFKVLHDTKQLIDYDRPLDWMNYCNGKSNVSVVPKYHLSNYKIRMEVVDSVYHYIYLVDEKEGRRLNFACICDWDSNINVNDFQMVDTFMESDDILQIQRKIKDTMDYKHYYIDLESFKYYDTELELKKSREENSNRKYG